MVLEHAPVTGLSMLVSAIASMVSGEKYLHAPHRVSGAAASQHVMRGMRAASSTSSSSPSSSSSSSLGSLRALHPATLLCVFTESVPFAGLGPSVEDAAMTLGILAQMRVLERRWGSATFLSFVVTAAAVGVVALQLMWGPPGAAAMGEELAGAMSIEAMAAAGFVPASPATSVVTASSAYFTFEAVRVLSGAASIVPLTALCVRYMSEVPSTTAPGPSQRHGLRIPGTGITITARATFIVPLLKLILAPNGVLQPATHRRDGVVVNVGLLIRAALALIGLAFGLASTEAPLLVWWLRVFRDRICGPVIAFLRPALINPLFSGPKTATHAVPPGMQQQQQQQQQGPGGAAWATAGGGGGWGDGGFQAMEQTELRRRQPHTPLYQQQQQQNRHGDGAAAAAAVGATLSEAQLAGAVAQIRQMGLTQPDAAVISALRTSGGDVSMAVNILLGGM